MKTTLVIAFLLALSGPAVVRSQTDYWHQTNGPEGGTLREMTLDSLGHVILWTGGSGVYRSSDKGNSWHLLNKGLPSLNMGRGASSSSGYLFGVSLKNLVFRLNENAPTATWEQLDPFGGNPPTIYDILADPHGEIYLATRQFGVMRSDDNGQTWKRKNTGIRDSISKTAFDSSTVFLAIDKYSNIFTVTTNGRLYRSTDKGESWSALPARDPDARGINALVIAENGNIVIGNYGTKSPPFLGGRIFVSRDTGRTWDTVYTRPATTQENKNDIDKIIRVPNSPILYANAHGPMLRSVDNGLTWSVVDGDKRGDEPFSIGALGDDLYQMSEPDGIFYSSDNGTNWTPRTKGVLATTMWGVSINSKQELFGITEYGLWRSIDNGNTWDQAPEYGETYYPSLYIDKNDYLFIGTSFGLFRSKDNGETLDHVVLNLDTSLKFNIIVQVGANDKGKLFCSSLIDSINFITSADNGDHWAKVTNLPEQNTSITAFAFASKDTILLASSVSSYYRSIDDGDNWSLLSQNNSGTSQLLIHPDGSYLSLITSESGGIFRSIDGAKTWARIFPPEDFQQRFAHYYSMMIDDAGNIVVCTDTGIYRSSDPLFSQWLSKSSGMTAQDFPGHFVSASQVVENPISHEFFAGSRGLSVFRSIPYLDSLHASVGAIPSPSASSTPMAFPNPFASTTEISYTLTRRSEVRIDIYDLLGKHLRTLFQGAADMGSHTIQWSAADLPAGTYAIVVHDGSVTGSTWVKLVK